MCKEIKKVLKISVKICFKKSKAGFPWWSSGKEPAHQCKGHGPDPCSGRFHMHVGQLNQCATTTEPVPWSLWAAASEAHMPRASALQQKKSLQGEAGALQLESSPHLPQLEICSKEGPVQSK